MSGNDWYPSTVKVGPAGTPATYRFLQSAFSKDQKFNYAEFGIYKADTAFHICNIFSECRLFLFDFQRNVDAAAKRLKPFGDRVQYFGNSQLYNDSYNWSLLKMIQDGKGEPVFDYCFLDGAHTFAVDALTYFLCDRLLRVGGYLDFDDYGWRLRGSSLDPAKVPAIADQYTEEQINAFQVKLIVDELVRRDNRYREVVRNKVFQKIM